MLTLRKCWSLAAARRSSQSLHQWSHAQTKQAVEGIMERGALGAWRLPSCPQTIPTSPFSLPMMLLATRGAKRGTVRSSAHPKTKSNSRQQDRNQHLDVKSTSETFVRWEIPWGGKTVIITMTAVGISFLFTGFAVGIAFFGFDFKQGRPVDLDKKALVFFTSLLLQIPVTAFVIKACIRRFSPLPKGLFSYDWRDPFSSRRGWLLWGVIGTFCSFVAVWLAVAVTNTSSFSRGHDVLLQVLQLIGASGTSTTLLLTSVGILAPIVEETIFRGFLLASLTKWVPTYVAILGSAGAFAFVHFTPAKSPELFALGVVFGFSYAKTGNLLTPIMIHGLWNSIVILILLFLQRQGYDIQKLVESLRWPINQPPPHRDRKE